MRGSLSLNPKCDLIDTMAVEQKLPHEGVPEDPDDGRPELIDEFVARNREELNTSFRDARLEIELVGQTSQTVEGIIASGLKRHNVS